MAYITMPEAAKILRVSLPVVRRMIRNGANGRPPLPAKKLLRSVRISVSAFEAWMAAQPSPVAPKSRGRPKASTKSAMKAKNAAEVLNPLK